ncbi:uncharacterized protein LOC131165084 [Malania oleifera]|uniref:uncharacterized protein LOC131165084 n=1 Tax=Malania oleifera TaxID=397392 RepID=UPI0025AE4101|nr:uncharacterized protein LOC131165084 [Malania oleifera]
MGGGGRGRSGSCSSSSSGEEDGDADWKAAIDSVAATTFGCSLANGFTAPSNDSRLDHSNPSTKEDRENKLNHPKPKPHQNKAQKLLDDILEKTIEIVRHPIHGSDDDPAVNEGGIKLFKHSPLGIVFDHMDELQGPKKRPRLLPGEKIDEKSKKFKQRLESVAVDGIDIVAAARDACKKSLARLEARDAAAKAAAKKEEERVAELKRIRGEQWLPSIAREMGINL